MALLAKLVRGKTYYLGNKLFTAGKEVEVTEDERAYLEEEAVDMVNVEGRAEARQKFSFREGEAPKAEEPEVPRVRRRKPASE